MNINPKDVISRIGETDQLYLTENNACLALERAELRLQLVILSQVKGEKIHFLQEAIVLLEQARIEYEDIPIEHYVALSLHLAKAYMLYFEISHEQRFALITQQILKPLAHYKDADIYFMLAYASVSKNELALTQHWLKKYLTSSDFDLAKLQNDSAFNRIRSMPWFNNMIKTKAH